MLHFRALRIEREDRLLERQPADLDPLGVDRADARRGQELQVVVALEGELVVVGQRVVAHDGGADRVGADAVAADEDQLGLDRGDALDPGAFAAAVGLDAVDDRQVDGPAP